MRLHYLDWSGGPDALILLHGGALSAHSFDLLALALGERVRCLALDLRGHGLSAWSDSYRVEDSADDVVEFVQHLGLPRAHIAGMSFGGCVAGHAAPRIGRRLGSLAFIDVGPQVNFAATARLRAFMASALPAASVEEVVGRALAVSPRTDPVLMLYRYQALLTETPDGVAWRADRRFPVDFEHILGRLAELNDLAQAVACPTLVVKGGRSQVLTEVDAAAFARRFPKGDAVVIPGAGHNVQEDQPVALAGALGALIHRSTCHEPDPAVRRSATSL